MAESYLGNNLDEFSVEAMIDADKYIRDYDGWLRFAFERKVNCLKFSPCINMPFNYYFLTAPIISNNPVGSLTSLYLGGVGVNGEVLEHLLSVCPLLEELSVSYSHSLVDFTVAGPSLKLKNLELYGCWSMKRLCIRDVNLVSLKYADLNSVIIENTPHLVTACFTVTPGMEVTIPQILRQLPQLQTQVVVFLDYELRPFQHFPLLRNLREVKLVLTREIFSSHSNLCANLLVASPFLIELHIEFRHVIDSYELEATKKLEHPHGCLKVAELTGFKGCMIDLGVALYIIENCQSLEKIVIDTHSIVDPIAVYRIERIIPAMRDWARALAREKLESRLHPRTHFVVK